MIIAIDLRPITSGKTSGIEMYIHNLLRNIFAIDKKNTYILYINSHRDFTDILGKYKSKNVKILQTKIPSKLFNVLLIFLRWPKIDKLIAKKTGLQPDIFFVPDLRPTPLSKKTKKITVIHDLAYMHFPHFFSIRSRIWFKIISPAREMAESTKLIAVSKYTAQDLINTFKINKNKIVVIHEAANHNLLKIDAKKMDLKVPKSYFLSLCTLEPRKNLHTLIKAYKEYKSQNGNSIKLVIAGKYNKKAFAKLNFGTDQDIVFTGFVNKNQKAYLLKNAVAMIYPSLFEGFGLPLLEAMIFNTPIITSNTSSMPEVVEDSAILIDPTDSKSLAQAMVKIQDHQIVQNLKQKMQNRIKEFSWEKCAKETLETITNVFE